MADINYSIEEIIEKSLTMLDKKAEVEAGFEAFSSMIFQMDNVEQRISRGPFSVYLQYSMHLYKKAFEDLIETMSDFADYTGLLAVCFEEMDQDIAKSME